MGACTSRQKRKSIDDEVNTSRKKTTLMNDEAATTRNSSGPIQWLWNSSANPFSELQPEWHPYDDIENMIIEEAFLAREHLVEFDDYHIDLEHKVQISNNDSAKQRQVTRMVCGKDDKYLRKNRFLPNPVAPDRPFGDQYGFISPFVKEVVVKHLKLTPDQLPSKNKTIIPEIVEKAALGIIEEGKEIRKRIVAERIAKTLREKKEARMEEVWRCCAHLYTKESFLFYKINEAMRLIGSKTHEQAWRNKVHTLGPFSLLLWDCPFNSKMTKPGTIFYRGTQLPDNLIASFMDECSKDSKPLHSFQAFTSCTRNRNVAEMYGNIVFIMTVRLAFTVNLQPHSQYGDEEEELLIPGVCFTIDNVEFDKDNSKPLIYLTLQQRHNSKSTLSFIECILIVGYAFCSHFSVIILVYKAARCLSINQISSTFHIRFSN